MKETVRCLQSILRIYVKEEKRYIIFIIDGLIKKVCRSGSTAVVSLSMISREMRNIWSGV